MATRAIRKQIYLTVEFDAEDEEFYRWLDSRQEPIGLAEAVDADRAGR